MKSEILDKFRQIISLFEFRSLGCDKILTTLSCKKAAKNLGTLDFKDIIVARNSNILLMIWVYTETYSKKVLNEDGFFAYEKILQFSFS